MNIYICDRIWENMHSSHIQFFNFGDSQNLFGMMDRCKTFTNCRTTIPLLFLKVSHLNTIPCGFYESPNEQNRMCELCTFSKSGHIYACIERMCAWVHVSICIHGDHTSM